MTAADSTQVDPDLFRSALRRQAATVTVVTAAGVPAQGDLPASPPVGFTATSFTSVSLHPPLVSFCLGRNSSSWPTVRRTEHLAVHLLASGQQEAARVFATSGIDRFASHPGWRPGPYGVPVLDRALAWLVCRVTERVIAGDHAIVIAEPLVVRTGVDVEPLLYHAGRYVAVCADGDQVTVGSTAAA